MHLPIEMLLGKPPKMTRVVRRIARPRESWDTARLAVQESLERVLRLPAVADKSFLITIGDRTVGGLISRDPMVGPWQVPVSDVAVTTNGFHRPSGEATAVGWGTLVAAPFRPASWLRRVAD